MATAASVVASAAVVIGATKAAASAAAKATNVATPASTASSLGGLFNAGQPTFDFIVSTTEASINSGLCSYLAKSNQPVQYICFLVDKTTGNPTTTVALADLMKITNGVNPFTIPAGTPWNGNDFRFAALTNAGFCAGIMIQPGIPPGFSPSTVVRTGMPPPLPAKVLSLGSNANNVAFNMYCKQLTVIQNSPPSGWGSTGSWNVWSQPKGTAWYATTTVNLVMADLQNNLSDSTYLNNNPDQKQALLSQLNNLSGTAFSLKQLLLDLTSAVLTKSIDFAGVDKGSNAYDVLNKGFLQVYATAAQQYGQPIVSITAVTQPVDKSSLHLTQFERQVSLYKDANGAPIQNPSGQQPTQPTLTSLTTLDYLCVADGHPMPGPVNIPWNWIAPNDLGSISGVTSINRSAIGNYFATQLKNSQTVQQFCSQPHCTVTAKDVVGTVEYSCYVTPGQVPQTVVVNATGPDVSVPISLYLLSHLVIIRVTWGRPRKNCWANMATRW
jgi:hypothetical protein